MEKIGGDVEHNRHVRVAQEAFNRGNYDWARELVEGHEFDTDFDALMLRADTIAARLRRRCGGRYTSLRMEAIFWEGLADIAASRDVTVKEVVTEIDRTRRDGSLTSAIRVQVLRFYREIVKTHEAADAPIYRSGGAGR
jgi:predicted DNA-binding ribbon-helix-helix protein